MVRVYAVNVNTNFCNVNTTTHYFFKHLITYLMLTAHILSVVVEMCYHYEE